MDFTKKAEIFKAVINYGYYFTIIDELPEQDGEIYNFFVIDIDADEKFSIFQFEKTVIKTFTSKPVKRSRVGRAHQLFSLIQEYYFETRKPIFLIFQNAHLLKLKVFQAMKTVFESARSREVPLGILFVGDIPQVDKIINKDKGISLRSAHIHLQASIDPASHHHN